MTLLLTLAQLQQKNCGFVNFCLLEDAKTACDEMNGFLWRGHAIKINYAKVPNNSLKKSSSSSDQASLFSKKFNMDSQGSLLLYAAGVVPSTPHIHNPVEATPPRSIASPKSNTPPKLSDAPPTPASPNISLRHGNKITTARQLSVNDTKTAPPPPAGTASFS